MKHGLIEAIKSGIRLFTADGSNYVGLKPPPTEPTASFDITLFDTLPDATEAIVINPTGQLSTQPLGGGDLNTQLANTVFAGPASGGAAAPTFRSLTFADLSALVGNGANTFAAGNDARLHQQNTDTGTNSTSFLIDNAATGFRIKNSAGTAQIRNSSDTAFADLQLQDLTVEGTLTVTNFVQVTSETVTFADSILILNSDATGTATQNAGLEIERGNDLNVQLLWQETENEWQASGTDGVLRRLGRRAEIAFTNTDLVSGLLTFNHGLDVTRPIVQLVDANGKTFNPDDITFSNSNSCQIDLTSWIGFTGTFYAVAGG